MKKYKNKSPKISHPCVPLKGLGFGSPDLTIYAPMIYTAPCVMFLM